MISKLYLTIHLDSLYVFFFLLSTPDGPVLDSWCARLGCSHTQTVCSVLILMAKLLRCHLAD